MKKVVKIVLIATASVILVAAVVVIGFIGLMAWLFRSTIDQSNGPTSREKALSHCNIPLPESASNVQYALYCDGWMSGCFYARFEAPVADCYTHAKTIYAAHAKDAQQNAKIPKLKPVNHPLREQNTDIRLDWFDNDRISKGVESDSDDSEPKIWIDEERGIFYFREFY
jgi:hypothetical protein